MKTKNTIQSYIEKHPSWSKEMVLIREVFLATELSEDIKWGTPSYMLGTKIIAGFAGFKNHMGIWFHQGVFLKDEQQKLVNAQEGKTKALRQWRIEKGGEIDTAVLKMYVEEAVENCKAGKEIKQQRKKKMIIPIELDVYFKENSTVKVAFNELSLGKQNEYANYISEAKREATKMSRLEKIVPMILKGAGLHDKYKNC